MNRLWHILPLIGVLATLSISHAISQDARSIALPQESSRRDSGSLDNAETILSQWKMSPEEYQLPLIRCFNLIGDASVAEDQRTQIGSAIIQQCESLPANPAIERELLSIVSNGRGDSVGRSVFIVLCCHLGTDGKRVCSTLINRLTVPETTVDEVAAICSETGLILLVHREVLSRNDLVKTVVVAGSAESLPVDRIFSTMKCLELCLNPLTDENSVDKEVALEAGRLSEKHFCDSRNSASLRYLSARILTSQIVADKYRIDPLSTKIATEEFFNGGNSLEMRSAATAILRASTLEQSVLEKVIEQTCIDLQNPPILDAGKEGHTDFRRRLLRLLDHYGIRTAASAKYLATLRDNEQAIATERHYVRRILNRWEHRQ